jgi:hypothetical protein
MSLYDLVTEATGSIEAAWQICQDNGLSITDDVVPGTVYVVSDAALALGSADVRLYIKRYGVQLGTLWEVPEYVVPLVSESGVTFATEDGATIVTE